MRVVLIAAITADGFIARSNPEISTSWTSPEDTKFYVGMTKELGVMIMGSTTFKTIGKALPGRRNMVYSSKTINVEGIETVSEDPKALIKRLENDGHESVAICGGSAIYDMFLQAGLIDELYLTIEPVIFGNGVSLFRNEQDNLLELQSVKNLSDQTVVLHYKTKR